MAQFIFLIFTICTGIQAWAHQPVDGDIYASLGAFSYMTVSPGENEILLAPGISAEADIGPLGGIEISMFYLRNPFIRRQHGDALIQRVKRMYISTGYRYWPTSWMSAAIAFATSYSMGDVQTLRDDFVVLRRPQTSASTTALYGVDLSLQIETWRNDRWAVVVDARYGHVLTEKRNEDADHAGVFVALKYFVQSHVKAPGFGYDDDDGDDEDEDEL